MQNQDAQKCQLEMPGFLTARNMSGGSLSQNIAGESLVNTHCELQCLNTSAQRDKQNIASTGVLTKRLLGQKQVRLQGHGICLSQLGIQK